MSKIYQQISKYQTIQPQLQLLISSFFSSNGNSPIANDKLSGKTLIFAAAK